MATLAAHPRWQRHHPAVDLGKSSILPRMACSPRGVSRCTRDPSCPPSTGTSRRRWLHLGRRDIEPCFCTQNAANWAHVRHVCKESCIRWPGPICGTCWAASCECGYVFDDVADAAGRWFTGVACAATNARTWARDGKGAYESVFGLTFSLLGAWWDFSECVVCAGRRTFRTHGE